MLMVWQQPVVPALQRKNKNYLTTNKLPNYLHNTTNTKHNKTKPSNYLHNKTKLSYLFKITGII